MRFTIVDRFKVFVDHSSLEVSYLSSLLEHAVLFLLVLGYDVLVLLIKVRSILLVEEYLMLCYQDVFQDPLAFGVKLLSLDDAQAVEDDLA